MMNRYLDIFGSEKILSIYGDWPSFHDAEIVSVTLNRDVGEGEYGPWVKVTIHCFQITSEVIGGHFKTEKHNVITLAFYDVVEFELAHGFGHQNPLSGLTITDVRKDQQEKIHYKVSFNAHMECDLHFKCSRIDVLSVEEGIPRGSIYA